jgi:hypothetical protein
MRVRAFRKIELQNFLGEILYKSFEMTMTMTMTTAPTTAMTLSQRFPADILAHIFSYDSTYREKFHNCLEEIEWNTLINQNFIFDSHFSDPITGSLYNSWLTIRSLMIQHMYYILPHLQRIGCKPNTFFQNNCFWHVDHKPHIRRNAKAKSYWKTTIIVSLFVKETTLEMDQWFEEELQQHKKGQVKQRKDLLEYDDSDDDETVYTYDSEGFRCPIGVQVSPYRCPKFEPIIYESPNCKIHTNNLYDIVCEFKGVKIPI